MSEPVDITFRINNDELAQQAQGVVNSILGIGKSSDTSISELESNLQNLKSQYKELGSVINSASKWGAPPKALTDEYEKISQEIKEAEQRIKQYDDGLKKTEQTHISLRTQIRAVKEEMAALRNEAEKNNQTIDENKGRYAELREELGRLTDIQRDIAQQGSVLSNDEQAFQGVIQGLSGIAGGFSAATGAVSLFAGENENMQKIMVKVQSLMAITIGLQQVAQTLNKDSAFRLVILKKAQDLYSLSVLTTGKAFIKMGLSATAARIAAQALMATLTFGLGVAIAAAVTFISKWVSKSNEAKEANKEIAKSASESVASLMKLSAGWKALGNNLEAQKKFLKENGDEIKKLTGKTLDLTGADNLFIKNTGKFIEALILRARAEAKYKEVQNISSKIGEVDQKLDAEYEKLLQKGGTIDGKTKEKDSDRLMLNYTSQKYQELKAEREKYKKEAEDFINENIRLTERERKILKELGLGAADVLAGSIEAVRDKIAELNKQYESAIDEKTKSEVLTQIKEQESLLKKLDGRRSDPDRSTQSESQNRLNAEKKLSEMLRKIALDREKFNLEIREREIGTMQDSFEKQYKIVQLNYDKQTQAAREFAENKLREQQEIEKQNYIKKYGNDLGFTPTTVNVSGLPKEVFDQIKQLYDMAEAEYKSGNKRIADEIARFAEEQRDRLASGLRKELSDIEKYYRDRIKQASGNEALLTQLYAGWEKEKKDAVLKNQLEILDFENEISLRRMAISKRFYLLESDREKSLLNEQKKALQMRLILLLKRQKNLPTPELEKEIEVVKIKIQELNAEIEKIPVKKFNEVLSGFQQITSALGNLDGEIGEMFSNLGSHIEGIKTAFDDTASGLDKISSGIAAVVDIINMVVSANKKRKQAEKEFYQNQIALAHEYALALNEVIRTQSQVSESGFVTDYAGRINDGFSALSDAAYNYQSALDKLSEGKAKVDLRNAVDWGNVGKGAASGAAIGAAIGSVIPVIGTAVGAVVGAIGGFFVGLFGGKKKTTQYAGLLEVFPELVDGAGNLNKELAQTLINTNQVDDKTKQLIQNALDWTDAMEQAHAQIKEVVVDLAGDLGNGIKNALVDAFKAGENASKRMFDAASKSMEKFIEDLVFSSLFSQAFKDFEDALVDSFGINGDWDIVDDYDRLMDALDGLDAIYLASLEAIKNRANERGFDMWGKEQQTAKTGAMQSVTQDSFDLWLGQFTAIRIHTSNIYDEMVRERGILNASILRIDQNVFIISETLKAMYALGRKWENEGIKVA